MPVRVGPLLFGSFLPDVPLVVLTFAYFFYRSRFAPVQIIPNFPDGSLIRVGT